MTHPHDQDGQSLRDELLCQLATQREVILDLCERVERLEMRADGLTPIERVERRWAREAVGPAVQSREPAAAAGEPKEVGPLLGWLGEQAIQAADAGQLRDAGMLTWASQVIGESVDEDAPDPPAKLPDGYIDPGHSDADREMLKAFYLAARSEGGTTDEITLRGIRAAIAISRALAQPAPPAEGEGEVNP